MASSLVRLAKLSSFSTKAARAVLESFLSLAQVLFSLRLFLLRGSCGFLSLFTKARTLELEVLQMTFPVCLLILLRAGSLLIRREFGEGPSKETVGLRRPSKHKSVHPSAARRAWGL